MLSEVLGRDVGVCGLLLKKKKKSGYYQIGIKIRSEKKSRWTKTLFLKVGVEGVNHCFVSISVCWKQCCRLLYLLT